MSTTMTTTKTSTQAGTLHLKNDAAPTDIANLPAGDALRLLAAALELLVKVTGDIPPTPPPRTPTDPKMSDFQAEKEIIARASCSSGMNTPSLLPISKLSLNTNSSEQNGSGGGKVEPAPAATGQSKLEAYRAAMTAQIKSAQQQAIDGVKLKKNDAASTPEREPAATPVIVVAAPGSQLVNTQHGAITRKFYSKAEPPITITQYLLRLHQFCPMSTAVYLATSVYIHRLAVEQRAIPVTRRNVHRLALAGLRVASKALEDLAYPHAKMAKVGGVSEAELARLEISFCFLAGFELVIGREGLTRHWESLRDGRWQAQEKALELRIRRPPKNMLTPEEA